MHALRDLSLRTRSDQSSALACAQPSAFHISAPRLTKERKEKNRTPVNGQLSGSRAAVILLLLKASSDPTRVKNRQASKGSKGAKFAIFFLSGSVSPLVPSVESSTGLSHNSIFIHSLKHGGGIVGIDCAIALDLP